MLHALASADSPEVEVMTLLTNTEVLRVVHVKLMELGWHKSWGWEDHQRLTRALDRMFKDDDEHLRRR